MRLSIITRAVSVTLAIGALSACGGPPPAESASSSPTTENAASTPAPKTFAEQVTLGQALYGEKCARCHGPGGEGTDGPRVVGLDKGALPLDPPSNAKFRKTQFKTVMDVAEFVVANMPPNAAGSLSAEEYFSVLAFDLKANGIDLGEKKLDAALAKTLVIPR
jgi:cytochrome c